jgi:putative PIN family toxin of toxin-antitoxin system
MLYELEEVLHYPRIRRLYGLREDQIRSYLDLLVDVADLADLREPLEIPLADRDDWMVLRTAIEGNAEFLCSSDKGFFGPPVVSFCAIYDLRIVRPAELLLLLDKPS